MRIEMCVMYKGSTILKKTSFEFTPLELDDISLIDLFLKLSSLLLAMMRAQQCLVQIVTFDSRSL